MALATATDRPVFDRRTYLKLTTHVEGTTAKLFLPDVVEHLERKYGKLAVQMWRTRQYNEGGYGPMALPEPTDYEERGDAAPRPWWWSNIVDKWAYQVGRRSLANGEVQKLKPTGKSGATKAR